MPQRTLPFSAVRNSELFANHWVERRLPLEPEWEASSDAARACLDDIAALWTREADLLPTYGEAALEDIWIRPVLRAFGWQFIPDTHIGGSEPDYALFLTDEARRAAQLAGKTRPEFWDHPKVVGEAKPWNRNLDKRATTGEREFPPEQIERYMDRTRLDWGLLTNGRLWRFMPRERRRNQPRFETFLELDIERLLRRWTGQNRSLFRDRSALDEFLPWYLLATPAAFTAPPGLSPLIDRALSGSTAYRIKVGDELREQVFEALRLCVEGFLIHEPNGLDPQQDLEACRANAFTLLFRLLFILFAEDRGLLPFGSNRLYTENRSLTKHHEILRQQVAGLDPRGTGAWQHWTTLFDLIDGGHANYGVHPYNGGLFEQGEHPFLANNAIPDTYAQKVLDCLRRATDPESRDRDRVNVDYRDLAIQHLGNIYEGLLELRPRFASQPMVVVRATRGRAAEKTVPKTGDPPDGFEFTDKEYNRGHIYLETDKGERRASGSYYTPDHIVEYIVENALGPLCAEIDSGLRAEIAALEGDRKRAQNGRRDAIDADLARLRSDYDDRALRLAVLDPAMGSGHFLIAAIQFLAAEIATNPNTGDPDEPAQEGVESDRSTLLFWKRRVVERCIYGVDKNPIAVELAKLALWLETVSTEQPLSFLDHHLRHGDSLIGAKIAMLGRLPDRQVPAGGVFQNTIEQRLPTLIAPLDEIQSRPSVTLQDLKEKERLYRRAFEPVHKPFVQVANLWLSSFFTPKDAVEVNTQQYAEALGALGQPQRFKAIAKTAWFAAAEARVSVAGVDAFHWELEFPEVFLAPRRTLAGREGFDAIIGNPPWGHAAILDQLGSLPHYAAATEDHSECFMALAVSLLRNGGRLGLVIPDTVLGPNKAPIRRFMLEQSTTSFCYNIGPDWFTSDVRMSAVLWGAARGVPPVGTRFRTCILPIDIRRKCQNSEVPLSSAIAVMSREADVAACLADEELAIPLFGDSGTVAALDRAMAAGPTIEAACDRGRGVELNKGGEVFQCPHCGDWGPPPRVGRDGSFRLKTCAGCGREYQIERGAHARVLVSTRPQGRGWQPYIDGDSVHRYTPPHSQFMDTTADGLNYKPLALYTDPKVLIRQAGIGLNAILDMTGALCPQSVYVYRVRQEHRATGFDESLLLAVLSSRLFQLQVFTAFGEIDSSRAFAKLTHARLARLRLPPLSCWGKWPALAGLIRDHVRLLCRHGASAEAQRDWEVEAAILELCGLSEIDVRAILRSFAQVHANETVLALFPGGVAGREAHWLSVWREAAGRVASACRA